MADKEKKLSFEVEIIGLTNEDIELSKAVLHVKDLVTQTKELDKAYRAGKISQDAYIKNHALLNKELVDAKDKQKELNKVLNSAPDSLNRMRAELIKLKDQYANTSAEGRDKLIPQITKLTTEVSKAEQAVGVFGRNVGNYGSAFDGLSGRLLDIVKNLSPVALIITGVTKVMEGLKEAFASTTFGMNAMKMAAEGWKQMMYDILTTGKMSMDNMADVMKAQQKLNALRVEEYQDSFEVSKINRQLQKDRIEAADQTKTHAERLVLLNKVKAEEAQITEILVGHLQKEFTATVALLEKRPKDEKLLARLWELKSKINDTYAEEDQSMRRVETQRTKFIQEEIKEHQDRVNALVAGYKQDADEFEKEQERKRKIAKEVQEDIVRLLADEKKANRKIIDDIKESVDEHLKKNFTIKKVDTEQLHWSKDVQEKNQKILKQGEESWTAVTKDEEGKRKAIKEAVFQGAQMGLDAAFESKKARLVAEMNAELSNANLTASQKTAIQKKYAKEEQQIEIKQAKISGALAVMNGMLTKPFIPAGLIAGALAAIQAGVQIATIQAQKFATGGKVQGGYQLHNDTSRDNTLVYVKQGEAILNERQISMLGGSGALNRIGVPGFASGGRVGPSSLPPIAPASGFDMNEFAEIINNRMSAIEVSLNLNKVVSGLNELNVITTTQKI
jgi:hypothetical protein